MTVTADPAALAPVLDLAPRLERRAYQAGAEDALSDFARIIHGTDDWRLAAGQCGDRVVEVTQGICSNPYKRGYVACMDDLVAAYHASPTPDGPYTA